MSSLDDRIQKRNSMKTIPPIKKEDMAGEFHSNQSRQGHYSTARSLTSKNSRTTSRLTSKSCSEMRSSSECFGVLTDAYKSFMVKLPDGVVPSNFPMQFKELSELYDGFARTATSHLANIRSQLPDQINSLNRKNSYFNKQAISLVQKLEEFFATVNTINAEGTKPHFKLMNKSVTELFQAIETIHLAICGTRVAQDGALQKYGQLYSLAMQVKKVITEVFDKPRTERFNDFDFEVFKSLLLDLCSKSVSILSKGMPLSIKSPPMIAQIRSTITSACLNLSSLMESAINFDTSMTTIRSLILEFGRAMNQVFSACQLEVKIEFKNDNPPPEPHEEEE